MKDDTEIFSVIVGLIQTLRDGCIANDTLPEEVEILGKKLRKHRIEKTTQNSTKLYTYDCEPLILNDKPNK